MGSLDFGRRLLPALVDEIATIDPERTFVHIPRSTRAQDGFQDISYRAFARAVDNCSWWIEQNLGRARGFPTIAYMGPQDIRYLVLILACNKTGYKVKTNLSHYPSGVI